MFENVLEYVVSDAYYQLWLTAKSDNPVRGREDFLPELVAQLDPADVPDFIEVTENEYNMNGDHRFHCGSKEPSMKIKQLAIVWGEPLKGGSEGEYQLNRKDGPARIVLTEIKKWHHNGELHRRRGDAVIVRHATFTWAKDGKYLRADGPYHLSIRGIQAEADKGLVGNFRMAGIVPSWSTLSQRKLSQQVVRDVIQKNKLKVNLLSTSSVFEDPADEMVFLTEIPEGAK